MGQNLFTQKLSETLVSIHGSFSIQLLQFLSSLLINKRDQCVPFISGIICQTTSTIFYHASIVLEFADQET